MDEIEPGVPQNQESYIEVKIDHPQEYNNLEKKELEKKELDEKKEQEKKIESKNDYENILKNLNIFEIKLEEENKFEENKFEENKLEEENKFEENKLEEKEEKHFDLFLENILINNFPQDLCIEKKEDKKYVFRLKYFYFLPIPLFTTINNYRKEYEIIHKYKNMIFYNFLYLIKFKSINLKKFESTIIANREKNFIFDGENVLDEDIKKYIAPTEIKFANYIYKNGMANKIPKMIDLILKNYNFYDDPEPINNYRLSTSISIDENSYFIRIFEIKTIQSIIDNITDYICSVEKDANYYSIKKYIYREISYCIFVLSNIIFNNLNDFLYDFYIYKKQFNKNVYLIIKKLLRSLENKNGNKTLKEFLENIYNYQIYFDKKKYITCYEDLINDKLKKIDFLIKNIKDIEGKLSNKFDAKEFMVGEKYSKIKIFLEKEVNILSEKINEEKEKLLNLELNIMNNWISNIESDFLSFSFFDKNVYKQIKNFFILFDLNLDIKINNFLEVFSDPFVINILNKPIDKKYIDKVKYYYELTNFDVENFLNPFIEKIIKKSFGNSEKGIKNKLILMRNRNGVKSEMFLFLLLIILCLIMLIFSLTFIISSYT